MKKVICGFMFAMMLMISGAQAWADGTGPYPIPPNPKLISPVPFVLADGTGPYPVPPNPKEVSA